MSVSCSSLSNPRLITLLLEPHCAPSPPPPNGNQTPKLTSLPLLLFFFFFFFCSIVELLAAAAVESCHSWRREKTWRWSPGDLNMLRLKSSLYSSANRAAQMRRFSSEDSGLNYFLRYMDNLKNYEKSGVPRGAGTDSHDGFDLGRMRRLMSRLGNPQSNLKVVHIAGTKGKGSTAAFLSNILRQAGYSVGSYTSPHIQTIRERMCIGPSGEPVSVSTLNSLFHETRSMIDEAVQLERGCLSHFEVLTAMAFYLFALEKVDIAVVEAGLGGARDATNIVSSSDLALSVITTIGEEHMAALGGSLESIASAKSGIIKQDRPVVLGGPFLPHIESILRNKALLMSAPVVSASDMGNRSVIKAVNKTEDKPYQLCDILMNIEKDIRLSIELFDVKIYMLGSHQLQNAATATCAALCLREQGWDITNESIRVGIEQTYVPGRSQFLTFKETEALDLAGATILLDGAHTKESARALVNTIQMTFPNAPLILVVAMASDKDHVAFAREFLAGTRLDAVILTEVDIAGGKNRTTPSSVLKDYWIQASEGSGINLLVDKLEDYIDMVEENSKNSREESSRHKTIISAESSILDAIRIGRDLLQAKGELGKGIIVVTGSLHIVSSVLASLH